LTGWVFAHWLQLIVPLLVFIIIVVFGLWARLAIYKVINRQQQNTGLLNRVINIKDIWNQFLIWFILIGAFIAVQVSIIPALGKKLTEEGLGSILVLALTWTAITVSVNVVRFYLDKTKGAQPLTVVASNVIKIIIIVISVLITLEIWGVPTFPIFLILIAGIFILAFVFRHTLDNILAGFEITYGEHIKVGDFIKLESNESGYVKQISWIQTIIATPEGNKVIIPNHKIITNIIVNRNLTVCENETKPVLEIPVIVKPMKPDSILSVRELEVLSLVGTGATNREIAEKLIISEHTVKSHLRSILSKLNIKNRQQAAAYAERQGLISCANAAETVR
jgi:DNA-binding CsgD family transcriptional regulator/small-conductance mechanosensitive channel